MTIEQHAIAGPVIRIADGSNEVLVSPLGAQVVSWRHRGREMLWLTSTVQEGKPLRGGIPVCWPWFGPHPSDPAQPAHGIARMAAWQVCKSYHNGISLGMEHAGLTAQLDVMLGNDLSLTLTTHNTGPAPVTITAALHTYLAVDDIARVRVTGLDGAAYIDKIDGDARRIQRGDLVFDREVDRIYTADRTILHDGDRSIQVDHDSHCLVAWNPWIAKSARLGDMAPDDYRRMVCLETAWAGDDVRILSPGAYASLITALKPLDAPR
jgi:glucose-6-phosphate 1-epimerase